MTGFGVASFIELPIIPYGSKAVQKRDAKGRFISDWDIVPDPDVKPFPKEVGKVYLIDNIPKYDEETRLFHVNAPKPEVIFVPLDDEPERKICEYYTGNDRDVPPWWPIDPQPCCENCKRCAVNDEGTFGYCAEIVRGVSTGSEYEKAVLEVELYFFCKYWELKE